MILEVLNKDRQKFFTHLFRGMIIGFVIGGILIYFILDDKQLFFPFEDLNFQENDYFEFQSSSLHSRDTIITTSERLVLSLGFTNKQPYPLTIEPEVYTWIGKLNPVKETLPLTTYGPNHGPTGKNNVFTAPVNEGENFFKVALKISYGNGTFIDYLNDTVTYNILSPESAIQERQNSTLFGSVVVAAFVGAGTIGALIWTNKISKKEIRLQEDQIEKINDQNDFLKEQAGIENRAWIGRTKEDPSIVLMEDHIFVNLSNHGKSPALNIKSRTYISTTEPPDDVFDKKKPIEPGALVPNEHLGTRIHMKPEDYHAAQHETLYFGIRLDYKVTNGKNGYYEIRGYYKQNQNFLSKVDTK